MIEVLKNIEWATTNPSVDEYDCENELILVWELVKLIEFGLIKYAPLTSKILVTLLPETGTSASEVLIPIGRPVPEVNFAYILSPKSANIADEFW